MVGLKNSLRTQLIFSSVVGLAFVILSVAYILFATIRLQRVVNDQFSTERFLQELQREVVAIREPLLDYLSSRSSGALAELLVEEQILRGMIPEQRPVSTDPVALAGREIYFLLDAYLDLLQRAIELKRARAIEDYTALYDEMERLNRHIVERIDRVSLFGLRTELDAYEELIARSRRMLFWNLVVIVAAFLSSSAWILFAIRRVTDPMDHLARTAAELSDGNFEVEDIEVDTVREMATVVSAFNRMKHDIRRYIAELNRRSRLDQEYMEQKLRTLKMEQILKRMELYTMQAQMNPHFLFNSLNTGVQLAIMERADRTADFMEHLAHFFRHNIRERDLIVPLRHEIEG
ncbi:MAG: histidine kinase, partial [Spirochaetales bacterium]|nr:histidine kinase [Spirochaetales bacterium]